MSFYTVRKAQGFVSRIHVVDADAPVVRTEAEKVQMHASIRQMMRDARMRK